MSIVGDVEARINDIKARADGVTGTASALEQQIKNQPEPDTDNITSEVVTLSMTGTTSITFTSGAGSISIANNGVLTLTGDVQIEGTDWSAYKTKIDDNETRSTDNSGDIGNLASLNTANKSNLVAAINEVNTSLINLSEQVANTA